MGVGLSSVEYIGEKHDAQIKVESEPEKGICFRLFFHNADQPLQEFKCYQLQKSAVELFCPFSF